MSSNVYEQISSELGISLDDVEKARQKSAQENISLMHAIEMLELCSEEKLLACFEGILKIRATRIDDMEIPEAIISLVPKDMAIKYRVIPIDRAGNNIILAMGDPRNLNTIDAIRFATGYSTKPVLASEMSISQALEKYYGKKLDFKIAVDSNQPILQVKKEEAQRTVISTEKANVDDAPVIKIVNDLLFQCMNMKASDIHIECYETMMRVRFRIDGVLHEIGRPPFHMRDALISRIKIMSNLNIAEKRLPQDGGIRVTIGTKPVDFRVSSIPAIYGEKIVLRILDRSSLQVDMTKLGFEEDDLVKFKESISRPDGMVLVTGPTGSGKTTTLYSALSELNKVTDNIMTAEDPVEFNLEGINQVQMKPDIDLNFAAALRSFLRQDPDVVMVGEVRDLETAEIAIKAALTGHLVLSTLHTNSAADTIVRLLNMGVESFNLVSALNAVVAQRLVRKVCEKCRVVDTSMTPELFLKLGIPENYLSKVQAYVGKGCPVCNFSGCKGRIAIHEVLVMSEPLKQGIIKGLPAMDLKKIALKYGMRSLRMSALNKMVKGIVPAIEVTQNTNPDFDAAVETPAAA